MEADASALKVQMDDLVVLNGEMDLVPAEPYGQLGEDLEGESERREGPLMVLSHLNQKAEVQRNWVVGWINLGAWK